MLKVLLKKQLMEVFRGYFVNQKTNKARTGGQIAGTFVLFGVLMLILMGVFLSIAVGLAFSLFEIGLGWLYYALMGVIAIALGTFGSVFNTYASLYLAKDNELLLSMPIRPRDILTARMVVVYGLSLLYSGIVWVPTVILGIVFGTRSVTGILFSVLLTFIIPVFVTALTCLLGWVVALVASRLKNKSFLTVIITLVLLGAYYAVCFRMTDFVDLLVEHSTSVSEGIRRFGNFLYQLGCAADGSWLSMLIFTGVTAALCALCVWILSRSFIRIITRTAGSASGTKKAQKAAGVRSPEAALLAREFKRFASSSTYMLNCGLGLVFVVVVTVLLIIRLPAAAPMLEEMRVEAPRILNYLPLAAPVVLCFICSMDSVTAPSVSLEGRTIWILRSLPVTGRQVLRAKLDLHWLVHGPLTAACAAAACVALHGEWVDGLASLLFVLVFVRLTGALGLILGVRHVNLTWTNESMPIKQSVSVTVAILLGWGTAIVCAGLCVAGYFLIPWSWLTLTICTLILAGADALCEKWLAVKGARLFEEL